MKGSWWDIFVAFLRPNLVGYGGGPAAIPLIEAEVVDRFKWLTPEEFANVLAVGNTLPGPIATKLAGYIGYQVGGWQGALIALVATIGPTVIATIVLFSILARFQDNPFVSGMIKGVRPVIWALFALLAVDYLKFVSNAPAALIAAGAFALLFFLHVHPAIVVVLGLLVGGVAFR